MARRVDVSRNITSDDVINELAKLFKSRDVPNSIRSNNGPEFTSKAISNWLERLELEVLYVEPGSPWENGYVESFNSRFRDEFLPREELDNVESARRLTTTWQHEWNNHRPHSSLDNRTPVEFASKWPASAPVAALQRATATENSPVVT